MKKKKETKEEIISAIKVKRRPLRLKETIDLSWSQLGDIQVQCDKCGHKQMTRTILKIKCIQCSKQFQAVFQNRSSNITWCPPGKEHILHRIISLELDGKYPGGL